MASTTISQTCSVEVLVWDHILVIPWMWFHWLQHPLSDWQPNFSQDFTWGWQICLQILTLFQYHNNTWIAHPHFWQYLDSVVYDYYTSLTSTPQCTVLATPLLTTAYIRFALSIGGLAQEQHPSQCSSHIPSNLTPILHHVYPCNAICNNYPIYAEICQIICKS